VTKIRTLVVDDEPMARERILSLLTQENDVEVIGECGDGVQAVSVIQQRSPDLVFLDVQMPGCDGFGVIQHIGPRSRPSKSTRSITCSSPSGRIVSRKRSSTRASTSSGGAPATWAAVSWRWSTTSSPSRSVSTGSS
jgi:CheY-like chemotaxis protein